ncbi:MAG TPA: rhodanese-related sulfurtransferase [Pyrinomonadaceae bacterium]|nr:rhodanese-related sulfurtransferase [Pyrinomonadaceae bacterium]
MTELRNLTSKEKLKKHLAEETEPRITISFYQYHPIENPQAFRDELFVKLSELEVFGRIYVAQEGINAQISVPEKNFEKLKNYLYSFDFLNDIRLNAAINDDGKSFYVLKVKARPKIVADGIDDPDFSMERRGKYLDAKKFNELAENPETVVVDMRNHYEYEVGHFENALEIPADTFREQLPTAAEMLADKKEKPVIMYCTGGIRCEKASAYLLHKGFKNVFHLEGGIIEYARQVKKQGLENKFKGRNFVFDERMGEQIGDEIISHCFQCGEKCDTHVNCENLACHLLFLQCENCREKFQGCCSPECQTIFNLPSEKQKELRKGRQNPPDLFCNSRKRRHKS